MKEEFTGYIDGITDNEYESRISLHFYPYEHELKALREFLESNELNKYKQLKITLDFSFNKACMGTNI